MKNKETMLQQYFETQNIKLLKNATETYRIQLEGSGRISTYQLEFTNVEGILQVRVKLPIRVERCESSRVVNALIDLNSSLKDNECFECDLINADIAYRLSSDCFDCEEPEEFHEAISKLIAYVLKILDNHSDRLLRLICSASIDAENEEIARILEEKEKARRANSPLNRIRNSILNMIGLISKDDFLT